MPLKGKATGTGASGSAESKSAAKGNSGDMKKTLQPRISSFQLNVGQSLINDKSKAPEKKRVTEGKKTAQIKKTVGTTAGKQTEPTAGKKEKPVYDKAATKKFDDMLDGDLRDLPPLPKSMVRVFLSSTFSDMRAERNILATKVYPYLRQQCASRDLDFQVVDMRWGVTEDSQNDHSVEKLCLLEVENCQKTSRGPNFVVLSGDRYGFRPIPTEISVEEFEILRDEAAELKLDQRETLAEWYKLDENAIPPVYILQPIRSKFTFYADYSPGCDEPRKKDTANWWKTFETLQTVLRKAADSAHKNKKMSAERKHQYFLSVTECEIQDGILKAADVDSHVLVYRRQLNVLDESALSEENMSRYIDVKTDGEKLEIDMDSKTLREDLIENKIPSVLKKSAIKSFCVPWKPGGIDPTAHPEHKAYLQKFCNSFIEDMSDMIAKALLQKQELIQMSNYYSDYEETIHHLKFCVAKCEAFCGQENVLDAAKSYILDDSARKPLVIYAQSGAGKTSIMAMIMKSIPVWLKDRSHIKLISFLGTTPNSINIDDVLFRLLGTLADATDLIMSPVNYKDFQKKKEYLPRHLRQVVSASKEPLIILLDSVDQLAPLNNAYSMEWLPTQLPQNVKLIISTLPEEHGILDNLRKILPDKSCYVEVPLLPDATGKEIVEKYLKQHKRKLTQGQMGYVLSLFKQAPTPLFLKLLLDEAKKWHSYTPMGTLMLASTVKEAINMLFENLEKKFGYTLVSHALGYITVGQHGLTEFEIEDVLSCDDKVLDEVYKFHDPPIQGIVRIPPVLWTRIRFDIQEYLVERVSYGKSTLNWYHRQFIATAREKYTSDGKDIELHKNLTDIYLQDEGIKRTITLTNRKNLTIENADRQVTPQPFTEHNRRKLSCLPYHLSRAYQLIGAEVAKKSVYCNFKFLCTTIAAFSVKAVKDILNDFIEKSNDEEAQVLLNFLSLSKEDLRSPVRLAVCLMAFIQPSKNHECLITLQTQAKDFLREKNTPLLIPAFPCLMPRHDSSNAVDVSVQGYSDVIATTGDSVLLKIKSVTHESDEPKAGYSVFNTGTGDFTPVDLHEKLSHLPAKLSYSGKMTYYVTGKSLVALDNSSGQKEVLLFKDMDLNFNVDQESSLNFSTNSLTSYSILSTEKDLFLINLDKIKLVKKLSIENIKPAAVIEKAYCVNSETEPKGVIMGKIVNSDQGDIPQGPDNQSFIGTFDLCQQKPIIISELESSLNLNTASLLCKDDWFIVGAFCEGDTETERKGKVLCFQLCPLMKKHEIEVAGEIEQLLGNPNKPEGVAVTVDGKLLVFNILKGEVTQTVEINNPISNVGVMWENNIALLGSVKGNIAFYDLKKQKNLGTFPAHRSEIDYITVLEDNIGITLGKNGEMKSWLLNVLLKTLMTDSVETGQKRTVNEFDVLDQKNVTSIEASVAGNEFITCSSDGFVRVWSVENQKLLRQYEIDMAADVTKVMPSGNLVMLDRTSGKFLILDTESGKCLFPDLPKNVIYFTTNSHDTVYIISKPKDSHIVIDTLSLKFMKISKTMTLQKELSYVSLDAVLTEKERFIVLRVEITDEEYNTIAAMWKKMGSFAPQPHRHKFVAVDLSEGTGGLLTCCRQLSKIPTLGTIVRPYQGNVMMVTTRRWVVFWDIITGKCDQQIVRSKNLKTANGMMYRPEWVGQECVGTTLAMEKSRNNQFVALGSEDGYMFIYSSETGLPRGTVKPSTKHSAERIDNLLGCTNRKHRTWVVFWDIVTGKCDQKPCRTEKAGMMYRPEWLGQDCEGTTLTLEKSQNKEFVTLGSEDGYVFIYSAGTGLPRGKRKPSTKHSAEVILVTISPDSKWVVSTCRNSVLKLWDSASGKEQFTMRLDAEVQKMVFTPDSQYLLVVTGSQTTRVLMFQIHSGTFVPVAENNSAANSRPAGAQKNKISQPAQRSKKKFY